MEENNPCGVPFCRYCLLPTINTQESRICLNPNFNTTVHFCRFNTSNVYIHEDRFVNLQKCYVCNKLAETSYAAICIGIGGVYNRCTTPSCNLMVGNRGQDSCFHQQHYAVVKKNSICSFLNKKCVHCKLNISDEIAAFLRDGKYKLSCYRSSVYTYLLDYVDNIGQVEGKLTNV